MQVSSIVWFHLPAGWCACSHGKVGSRLQTATKCSELIGKDECLPNWPDVNPFDYHVCGVMLNNWEIAFCRVGRAFFEAYGRWSFEINQISRMVAEIIAVENALIPFYVLGRKIWGCSIFHLWAYGAWPPSCVVWAINRHAQSVHGLVTVYACYGRQ